MVSNKIISICLFFIFLVNIIPISKTMESQSENPPSIDPMYCRDTAAENIQLLPPWVITTGVSNIDPWGSHATLHGTLLSKGLASSCDVWFVWDTRYWFNHFAYTHKTPVQTMNNLGSFSHTITGLQRGTTYHFRTVAYNGEWYDQGCNLIFTPGRPQVETLAATQIKEHEAILNGKLEDNGDVACNVWFIYDTIQRNHSTNEYRYKTKSQILQNDGAFGIKIDELLHSTRYYFCAVASNDAGTDYGEERNFTTVSSDNNPPTIPNTPQGPMWGQPEKIYSFTTFSTDPEENRIRYLVDWGDGIKEWTEYASSGTIIDISHAWNENGDYGITVESEDEYGANSTWSPTANITIEATPPTISMIKPTNGLYLFDTLVIPLLKIRIIGKITVVANASDNISGIQKVEFYVDNNLEYTDDESSYQWTYNVPAILFHKHTIKVKAIDKAGNAKESDEIKVWIFNI